MAQVVNSHVVEVRAGADASPGVLKIGQMGVRLPAGDHPRVIERLKDVVGDPDGYPLGGFPDRVAIEMRIARGRLRLAVT